MHLIDICFLSAPYTDAATILWLHSPASWIPPLGFSYLHLCVDISASPPWQLASDISPLGIPMPGTVPNTYGGLMSVTLNYTFCIPTLYLSHIEGIPSILVNYAIDGGTMGMIILREINHDCRQILGAEINDNFLLLFSFIFRETGFLSFINSISLVLQTSI